MDKIKKGKKNNYCYYHYYYWVGKVINVSCRVLQLSLLFIHKKKTIETGNTTLEYLGLDLASFKSIRQFVDLFHARY